MNRNFLCDVTFVTIENSGMQKTWKVSEFEPRYFPKAAAKAENFP
jgi:hypothetical protein